MSKRNWLIGGVLAAVLAWGAPMLRAEEVVTPAQPADCRAAAEKGDAPAQNALGRCYAKGRGVPQSWEEAVYWYRKAAAQGSAKAQEALKRLGK